MDVEIGGNAGRLTHGPVLPGQAVLGKPARIVGDEGLMTRGHGGQIATLFGYGIGDFKL